MLYRFQQGNCNDLSALLYGQPTEQKWGTLIFTTHHPELLDEYDRNDGICIVGNRNGITAENECKSKQFVNLCP